MKRVVEEKKSQAFDANSAIKKEGEKERRKEIRKKPKLSLRQPGSFRPAIGFC